jgi:drug/metabolite transporter (DMT)-like permease
LERHIAHYLDAVPVVVSIVGERQVSMAENSSWSLAVWGGLIGTPLLISSGQVLFKMVSARVSAVDAGAFRSIVVDPYFISAMIVYLIATFSWIFVLRSVPLAAAYSFTALGFLFVPILSTIIFGEMLTLRYFLGAALIMSGLTVIHS